MQDPAIDIAMVYVSDPPPRPLGEKIPVVRRFLVPLALHFVLLLALGLFGAINLHRVISDPLVVVVLSTYMAVTTAVGYNFTRILGGYRKIRGINRNSAEVFGR